MELRPPFFLSPVCDNVLWCIKISWRSYYSTSRWEWGSQVAGHALQTIRRCITWLSICRYCLSALPLVLYLRMGRVLTLPDIDRRQSTDRWNLLQKAFLHSDAIHVALTINSSQDQADIRTAYGEVKNRIIRFLTSPYTNYSLPALRNPDN